MKYLLDTNVFIHAVKGVGGVRNRLRRHSPGDLATSVVTLAELLYGALKSAEPSKARQRWLQVLAPFTIVDFSEACAFHHARIRFELRAKPIGERDLLIASVALACDMVLVTHNGTEFQRVSGLTWEDWF